VCTLPRVTAPTQARWDGLLSGAIHPTILYTSIYYVHILLLHPFPSLSVITFYVFGLTEQSFFNFQPPPLLQLTMFTTLCMIEHTPPPGGVTQTARNTQPH
jgi:hypothetical protein